MKVLVVDDSALMRQQIRAILESHSFEVIIARNGEDALEMIERERPDVVTLDINMPVMDGLTCLSRIMTYCPTPVLMFSSISKQGASATLEALAMGAVDYLLKPGGTMSTNVREVETQLVRKVRAAARARLPGMKKRWGTPSASPVTSSRPRATPAPAPAPIVRDTRDARELGEASLVLIGVSTGGPRTLEDLLPKLPADFPVPILIAQHMPSHFTDVFAQRLNSMCALRVSELVAPTQLGPGQAFIAKGDADAILSKRGSHRVASSVPCSDKFLWHPSVERMVRTALEFFPARELITVQLTGMGDDGAEAMTEVHRAGGRTIAESQETAVVYGMPRELVDRGGASVVLPVHKIADQLLAWTMSTRFARASAP